MRTIGTWGLLWLLATAAGGAWIAQAARIRQEAAFSADVRIAHRLLSQQAVQYDAVLATLALLGAPGEAGPEGRPERRLSAVYPAILDVLRRERDGRWSDPRLAQAEAASRTTRQPALAEVDLPAGRYTLVAAAEPVSHALRLDLAAAIPWRDWPMDRATSPVRLTVEQAGQAFVVQPGRPATTGGWTLSMQKTLASPSQPFDVVATRQVTWQELPWLWMALWAVAVGLALAAARTVQRLRTARRRAEELLRLGQVARLNTLGEMAAGLAHELNQPLTAILANTQAARRLLDDRPPELDAARGAMGQAAEQARRAATVIGRLRRAIERPASGAERQPVVLQDVVRSALDLLEPECVRHGVQVDAEASAGPPVRVLADPVALEQIVHNLLVNAVQALDAVPAGTRRIAIAVQVQGRHGRLVVCDSGPGIAAEVRPRLFEPFFTTRAGGLGLGLSLSETLAAGMGGTLSAAPSGGAHGLRGACFHLDLELEPEPA